MLRLPTKSIRAIWSLVYPKPVPQQGKLPTDNERFWITINHLIKGLLSDQSQWDINGNKTS